MIANKIQGMVADALRAHDEIRLSTLRLLSSAFNYEKIEKQHELTEEEEQVVIRKEAKKRKEAIEAYQKAGNVERAKTEGEELKILQEFLPPEVSDSDLEKIVNEAITQIKPTSMADMGKVIGIVKSKVPNADGGKIAGMVKSKING